MNPSLHTEPEKFDPARYLDKPLPAADYININDPYARDYFTYGAGRRVCPGVRVAERSLYINIVRTLWGSNIHKKRRLDGNPVELEQAMIRRFLSIPKPFECEITGRSPQRAQVIREAFAKAEEEGIIF